ncbi:hypothetical protein QE441_000856 [Chryseobacterium sp. SORGH_AS909]|nr:T9SS type A sorting domain-containing protein [Chryseobacterium sp. SORGH_AS_0909]MDR6085062.1 hypothetical protein [Chryseobacterium sp. SORGH_AS_0909]
MKYPVQNTDGDDKLDFLDLTSNGSDYDLYAIGKSDLDDLGGGFISRISDQDKDGIQAVVDTDLVERGAPDSPLSPYAVQAKNAQKTSKASDTGIRTAADDIKIYPNPVRSGESLTIRSQQEGIYSLFSAQGQLIKTGQFKGNVEITNTLPAGIYIIKIETQSAVKSYKVLVK